MKEIVLGIDGMTLQGLVAIARKGARVRLNKESEERIINARPVKCFAYFIRFDTWLLFLL